MAALAYLAGRDRKFRSLPEQVNQGQQVESPRKLNEDPAGEEGGQPVIGQWPLDCSVPLHQPPATDGLASYSAEQT